MSDSIHLAIRASQIRQGLSHEDPNQVILKTKRLEEKDMDNGQKEDRSTDSSNG